MDKSLIHQRVCFPTKDQASVMTEPSHRAFHFPPMTVTPQGSTILNAFGFATPYRGNQLNPPILQMQPQGLRIKTPVSNQMLRLSQHALKRRHRQGLLVRAALVEGDCQRNSLAVRHHHKLRTLAPPGNIDFRAPFFAPTKRASMKHCSHWIRRRWSSSRIKLCQTLSQMPSSSQRFKRLQQVLGLGYLSGRSFHRPPLRSTHKIPSRVKRLLFQGRPLLLNWGSNGPILFHCFSLKYIARLIGLSPPTSLYRQ